MRISKDLLWILPYLDSVKHIVELDTIASIKATRTSKNAVIRSVGTTTWHTDNTTTIVLRLSFNRWKHGPGGKCTSSSHIFSKIDILCTLAHELAHCLNNNVYHTPQHKLNECRITEVFMKHLLEEGYVSEEAEFKYKRKKCAKNQTT